jgi:hypothetical protein
VWTQNHDGFYLSQMNPFHILVRYFFKNNFDIIYLFQDPPNHANLIDVFNIDYLCIKLAV